MNLKLIRKEFRFDGIFGQLWSDSVRICFTLEHSYDLKAKIPPGTYDCEIYESSKFGRKVFVLKNVPGHDFIEIHMGDFNNDSDGCILLGSEIINVNGVRRLADSKKAFDKFMELQGDQPFKLTVIS